MTDASWKATERRTAEVLDGERVPITRLSRALAAISGLPESAPEVQALARRAHDLYQARPELLKVGALPLLCDVLEHGYGYIRADVSDGKLSQVERHTTHRG